MMKRLRPRRRRKGITLRTLRLALACALVLLCAFAAYSVRSEKKTADEPSTDEQTAFSSEPDAADAPESSKEKTALDVKAGGRLLYALQFGAFAERENALALAADIASQGAGGFVFDDEGLFRVLGAAFAEREQADAVKERLEAENGVCAAVFETELPSVSLRVTAGKERAQAVGGAFAFLDALSARLTDLTLSFDSGEYTKEQTSDALKTLMDELDACVLPLSGAKGEADGLIAALDFCRTKLEACRAEFSAADASAAPLASALRSCQLECIFALRGLLREYLP